MVQKPFWILEQHITERVWIQVWDFIYIYTHSKESVSTQSIFIAVLAMDFFGIYSQGPHKNRFKEQIKLKS